MNFSSQIFFNDINHGYRAAILKKNSLWLLPFYMVVATYFCYEKVRRTMRTAIISNLLNWRIFWITHLLDNLLFWGVVTTPQTPKIKSFAKIVFSNRSVLLQSAPSYMFAWVLATPLLLIFLISFEELNTLVPIPKTGQHKESFKMQKQSTVTQYLLFMSFSMTISKRRSTG